VGWEGNDLSEVQELPAEQMQEGIRRNIPGRSCEDREVYIHGPNRKWLKTLK
jgi:hypothetical protein